jgi:light-harvesting complex II chlorophyll a/b binding protein 7
MRVVVRAAAAGDDDEDQSVARSEDVVGDVNDDGKKPPNKADDNDVTSASSPLGDLISSPLFYVTFGVIGGVAVVSQFEDAALLLSALPIVGLTVLSKTDFGTKLEDDILAGAVLIS